MLMIFDEIPFQSLLTSISFEMRSLDPTQTTLFNAKYESKFDEFTPPVGTNDISGNTACIAFSFFDPPDSSAGKNLSNL